MKGQEEIMQYVMFVGELFIIFLFLYTMFGPKDSIGNSLVTYFTYVEPSYLQEYMSTILTVSSYAPGDLKVGIKIPAAAHTIEFKTENSIHHVSVTPPPKAAIKPDLTKDLEQKAQEALNPIGEVKFITPQKPTPFISSCSLPSGKIQLKGSGDTQIVYVEKSGDPCAIKVSVK